jgi:serine/threonine protein kinase/Tol biopolymer transport system component
MSPERFRRIEELYYVARERTPEERAALLAQTDPELRREVELLLSQPISGEFLDRPAIQNAPELLEDPIVTVLHTGACLGPYRIEGKLGEGGMGEVFRAVDTRLGRAVAIKTADAQFGARFKREARAIASLNHPHICTLYDIGPNYLVMELLEGDTIAARLKNGPLPLDEAVHYGSQIAAALADAHEHGIVHRDLKPANIMLVKSGVKVLDFGLASWKRAPGPNNETRTMQPAPTETGTVMGTAAYMSPEQAQGKKVEARTDIFSFGALLYEMITSRRAFNGDSTASILSAILRDEPKPAAEIIQGLPRELGRIITRCLQKDPDLRYQHAGDLKIDLDQVKEDLASDDSAIAEQRLAGQKWRRWWWLVAASASVAVCFAVWWGLREPQAAQPPWKLTRLTSDAGISRFPALSLDGKLVAYASDHGLDGGLDLYVKQVAGGQPIRLTSDGAGNTSPDFSPDGSKIVFRSNRDGGGIYEIPSFGGEVGLVARDGLNPKFSPDGSQVAYWVGAADVVSSVPGSGTVWVAPAAGGAPQRVGSNFTAARSPIWSPDGKHLLVVGYTSAKAYENSAIDWWLVGPDGGDSIKTGAYDALVHAGLQVQDTYGDRVVIPRPTCWSAPANAVLFPIPSGDALSLWEIGISPQTGKITGAPKRLTTGTGNEEASSCASGGALAFTNVQTRRDVWSVPFDLDRGTSKGALERVTQGPASRERPSLSNNGRYVAFASDQSGRQNIWIRDLATGKESSVASSSSFVQRYPRINASGAKVAFSVFEKDKRALYLAAPGEAPEKLCEGCLQATDWSRDEKALMVQGGNPFQINVLDLASHQQVPLLKHPTYNLLYGRFSPDNRWVSFTIRTEPNRGRIAIAPVEGPRPIPESAWITIVEAGVLDWADWSPDGKTLYFPSGRDGHNCLWGQRIEASSHRLVGEAFAVQHFHGRASYQSIGGWSAAGGRIAMVLVEETGNIWMMSRSGAR